MPLAMPLPNRNVTVSVDSLLNPVTTCNVYHGKRFLEPLENLAQTSASFSSSIFRLPTPIATPTRESPEDPDWPAKTFSQLLLERYSSQSQSLGNNSSTESSSLSGGATPTPTPMSSLDELVTPLLLSFASPSQPMLSAHGIGEGQREQGSDSDATVCSTTSSMESL